MVTATIFLLVLFPSHIFSPALTIIPENEQHFCGVPFSSWVVSVSMENWKQQNQLSPQVLFINWRDSTKLSHFSTKNPIAKNTIKKHISNDSPTRTSQIVLSILKSTSFERTKTKAFPYHFNIINSVYVSQIYVDMDHCRSICQI